MVEIAWQTDTNTLPLLAALYGIATMPLFLVAKQRVLVLISDLLENSQTLSYYRGSASFATVQPATDVAGVRGKLSEVEVMVIQRHTNQTRPYQTTVREQFWRAYMQAAGVASYIVQPF